MYLHPHRDHHYSTAEQLLAASDFDYNYSWLVILGVFVLLGIILPCCIRAYRRRKYGVPLFVRDTRRNRRSDEAIIHREPTAAEVSRAALASLPPDVSTQIHTSTVPSTHTAATSASSYPYRQGYSFPTSSGFKLSSAAENDNQNATIVEMPAYNPSVVPQSPPFPTIETHEVQRPPAYAPAVPFRMSSGGSTNTQPTAPSNTATTSQHDRTKY